MTRVRKVLHRRPLGGFRQSPGADAPGRGRVHKSGYLGGQLLVAMPQMTDKRFARSVIYVCTHSADGAM
jgi:Uncharacterized ACR, COG1678